MKRGLYRCIRLVTRRRRVSRASDDKLVSLRQRQRQRLFDDHMLAGAESGTRLRVVQEWRGGDVDKLDVRPGE